MSDYRDRELRRKQISTNYRTRPLHGSKDGGDGKAQHVLNAFAHENGLVLGQQPVDGKSNKITAITAFLERLALEGAIVTMDAMGAQKKVAARIVEKKADYILALKGNQGSPHEDGRLFLDDPEVSETCLVSSTLDAGHGRIEERTCRVTDDTAWPRERHPDWKGPRGIAAVTCARTDKKTRQATSETRFYITSLPPEAKRILDASRAHWSIENNLHWTLDVTFPRGCLPLPQGQWGPQLVPHSKNRHQPHQTGQDLQAAPETKTPQGRHRSGIQGSANLLLTIYGFALLWRCMLLTLERRQD